MSAAKAFLLIFCLLSACGPLQAPTSMAGPTDPIIRGATVVPSPTPTTAELIYPYTLEGLRHHNYQGGVIKIVSTLEQTPVYTRYLISYPSDGLTITAIMQIPAHGHAPFPVIVMNHGYFDREGYVPGDGTWRAAEYLNQHGYLTLASDYRSWGGSEVGPNRFYTGLAIVVV